MRWRVLTLDLLLASAGIALCVMTCQTWGGPSFPTWLVVAFVLLAGLPMGLVRRWPGQVTVYLAVLLVILDDLGAGVLDGVQILLALSAGSLARSRGWGWTLPAAAVACLATGVNLADPGVPLAANFWYYTVGIIAIPVTIGRYLRSQSGAVPEGEERAPVLDLLLAGGGVAFAVLGTWSSWPEADMHVWGIGLLAVIAGLALGVVRWLPGSVLLLESVVLLLAVGRAPEAADSLQVLLFIALGVFASQVTWRWQLAGYALTCMVTMLAALGAAAEVTAWWFPVLATLVAAPAAIGAFVRARRTANRREVELAAERARSDRLAERERIAREVHDIVAHHVGAMVLRAGAAEYAGATGPAAEALADIRATGHQVLEDLRGLLNVLRGPEAADGQLSVNDPEEVMRDAVARVTGAGLEVTLELAPEVAAAPLVARASAARIVQEGLTNVLKHAGPGVRVKVSVAVQGPELAVEISNEGGGRPAALPSSGQGIAGMRERAHALGGRLTAGPLPGGGWRLAAVLALPEEDPTGWECMFTKSAFSGSAG
ncbi:sensor histidine kinase [Acrocarpospora catenulata]|uniref:sensor histidine kinase n=1 Tax=Acrocarpospora catenulata TaxID=2836182 RepID=UPI001BDAF6A7|nr:histidine kinase [Acrocarpospora catenulata]